MDKFHKLSKLTQEEADNFNSPMSIEEIKFVVQCPPPKETSEPKVFTKFYQIFKEEIIALLYKLFQKIEEDRIFLKSFYEINITLIPKPDR